MQDNVTEIRLAASGDREPQKHEPEIIINFDNIAPLGYSPVGEVASAFRRFIEGQYFRTVRVPADPVPALRQGDVLLKKRSSLPVASSLKPVPSLVLAYGEVTGHKHEVHGNATLLEEDTRTIVREEPWPFSSPRSAFSTTRSKRRFLDVKEPSVLKHDEHGAIALDPGVYEVEIQREYDPFDETRQRLVLD